MPNERLEARVKARNRCHAIANELYPQLAEFFRPYVGQKIERADGPLMAKISAKLEEAIPKLFDPLPQGAQVWRSPSDYSLVWTVKVCEGYGPHSCCYEDCSVYVGNMRGGVLESLYPPEARREDFTADEIEQARQAYEAAHKHAEDLESKLFPFGESDR
jgi:hypothetical protein